MAPELLLLAPLAIAAGLDLYLTVLFLAVAPSLGWPSFDPAGLGPLSTLPVAALAAALYLLEMRVDRTPRAALVWNVAHTVVRPFAVILLSALLLHDLALPWLLAGSALAGIVALGVHTARTGWSFLLWKGNARLRTRLLASASEDVLVVALLGLSLDLPLGGFLLSVPIIAVGLFQARAHLHAGAFAHSLLRAAVFGVFDPLGWSGPDEFPGWLRRRLEEAPADAGVSPRGTPAGISGDPEPGLFRTGWVVIRSQGPFFLMRSGGRVAALELGPARVGLVRSEMLSYSVELELDSGASYTLLTRRDGPGPEALREEFGVEGQHEEPPSAAGVALDRPANDAE